MRGDRNINVRQVFLFILAYFLLFSYDSLRTYFTYDDATNLVNLHHEFDQTIWASIGDVLRVFTPANRPLGALFYRLFYCLFGLNPLPFRIAIELLLYLNISLAWLWTRALGADSETQALATLLFCYNASMVDLYYNTGTIYDILCFSLYFGAMIVYIRGRTAGQMLSPSRVGMILLLYLLALDAKEMAVTLPAALLFYELVYQARDLKLQRRQIRNLILPGMMLIAGALFSRVKVADLTQDKDYQIHLSLRAVVSSFAHYFEQLFYREQASVSAFGVGVILFVILTATALLRRREGIFGILFFVVSLLPVTVINFRSGYAAYMAYPGLTLALATVLVFARGRLARLVRWNHVQTVTAVLLFLLVAAGHARLMADYRLHAMGNMVWDQPKRVAFVNAFRQTIPEFPPGARVLISKDPWGEDWGPAFITRLLYRDPTLWVERTPNLAHPPDLASYDLVVHYKEPYIDMLPAKFLGFSMPWEIRASGRNDIEFKIFSPRSNGEIPNLELRPAATRGGHTVRLFVPGVSGGKIDALYRIVSGRQSTRRLAQNWCIVDEHGIATITAPYVNQFGALVVDWIRPAGGRWIFTSGVLIVAE